MNLFDKEHVKNHPLFKNRSAKLAKTRESMLKYAEDLKEDAVDKDDIFYSSPESNTEVNVIKEAASSASELLAQFDLPLPPQLTYNKVKNAKYGSRKDLIEGIVIFNCRLAAVDGSYKQIEIPVSVVNSKVVPPSVMIYEDRMSVIAQSSLDEVVKRAVSYSLQPLRRQYEPPLTLQEREIATTMRNEIGWQPRKIRNYASKKAVTNKYEEVLGDNPKLNRILREYYGGNVGSALYLVGTAWVAGEYVEKSKVYPAIEELEDYRNASDIDDEYKDDTNSEIDSLIDYLYETINTEYKEAKVAASTPKKVPAQYEVVTKEMAKAQKDGEDTFPRAWQYILRNYILKAVNTADKDAWEIHLMNDGWCLNPYSSNRGRVKQAKKAQEGLIEDSGCTYTGTRMPIEVGDPVKFDTNSGAIRGEIVEISSDNDTLIVKSKGIEYRALCEEVQPMNSTYKNKWRDA